MTEATNEFIPELFDAKANIRPLDSYSANDLARMSPARKELFMAAHRALSESAEVDQSAKEGDQAVRDAKALVSERRKVVNDLTPPWTAHDEWKRIVKHIERPEQSPEAREVTALAQAELATAEAELIALQETVQMCHRAIDPARKHAASAWERYHSAYPPKSAGVIHRELMEREKARKLAGTDKPQTAQRQFLCALDASMAVKGGSRRASRHPDGTGKTYDASFLNQQVAKPEAASWQVKPPSARS